MSGLSLRGSLRRLAGLCGATARTSAMPEAGTASGAALEVTAAELNAYRTDGFFVRERVFGDRDLPRLRAAAEEIHARVVEAGAAGGGVTRIDGLKFQTVLDSAIKWEWNEDQVAIRSMEPVHHLSQAMDELIDDERLCAPARGLIGTDRVSLFTDKLNFKRSGGAPFPWHQDAPYWAFGCTHLDRLASVQIYLDDATAENGCLWVIPGSHRFGHIKSPDDGTALGRLYTDVGEIAELQPRPLIAPAGSAIFFDGYIVHGSKSNRSASDRRALILTYQPAGLPVWNKGAERLRVVDRPAAAPMQAEA
jgi:hypothetical protein